MGIRVNKDIGDIRDTGDIQDKRDIGDIKEVVGIKDIAEDIKDVKEYNTGT